MAIVDEETGRALGRPEFALIPPTAEVTTAETSARLRSWILSASGWRTIFAPDEHSDADTILPVDAVLAALAALTFYQSLSGDSPGDPSKPTDAPEILVGSDARPTGTAIAEAALRALLDRGATVRYLQICAAPQIMAYARAEGSRPARPFFYVTASHNPIGHNGIKLGSGGGVLDAGANRALAELFRRTASDSATVRWAVELMASPAPALGRVFRAVAEEREASRKAYEAFLQVVVAGDGPRSARSFSELRTALRLARPGIVAELNGSARAASIDQRFLAAMGCEVHTIHAVPGEIAHGILPEGENLAECESALAQAAREDDRFLLGYVPDNDGDRGNLVYFDAASGVAKPLAAQEVFALACLAELAWLVHTEALTYNEEGNPNERVAVVVNGPTSMRIDRIAEAFGAEVRRAEVGEANVVGLAKAMREEGYIVRILGEGSNGGNITQPSEVRDPMATLMSALKLIYVGDVDGRPGLASIWRERRSRVGDGEDSVELKAVPTLGELLRSVPSFTTTATSEPGALMTVSSEDHGRLKREIESRFEAQFATRIAGVPGVGVDSYRFVNYEGMDVRPGAGNRTGDQRGGLKMLLSCRGRDVAFLWVRGSKTEPVFRLLVDVEGENREAERSLLQWLRELVSTADTASPEPQS